MAATLPLTDVDLTLLLARLPLEPARDRALIQTLLQLALRITSALSLTVGQVWDGERIRSTVTIERRNMKYGRGTRRRSISGLTLPINRALAADLDAWLAQRLLEGPLHRHAPLFPSRQGNGRAMSRWQANRILHRIFAAAGIPDLGCHGCHALRKTAARRVYISSGHNIMAVKYLLSHASLQSTCSYLADDREAAGTALVALGNCEGVRGCDDVVAAGRPGVLRGTVRESAYKDVCASSQVC